MGNKIKDKIPCYVLYWELRGNGRVQRIGHAECSVSENLVMVRQSSYSRDIFHINDLELFNPDSDNEDIELTRLYTEELELGVISQFQLKVEDRGSKEIEVFSEDNEELKFQYTDLSGYITIYSDIEKIKVRC